MRQGHAVMNKVRDKKKTFSRRVLRISKWVFGLGVLLSVLGVMTFIILWHAFPFSDEFLDIRCPSTIIVSAGGEPMRVYPGDDDSLCIPVTLEDMSPWLIDATLAVEDKRFYSHRGVDALAVLRAIKQNVRSMRRASGASTISMQLMRMSFNRERTIVSKMIEAFRALQLESLYGKDKILAMYLNSAPYGGNIYGVEAASRRYFGKSCRDLTLGEAALLAGLPQSPSKYRPDRHPEKAYARRATVLKSMLREGYLTGEQMRRAGNREYERFVHRMLVRAPHFCDWVRRRTRTSRVESFIDLEIQTMAEQALRRRVDELSGQDVTNGAVIVIDVERAAIVAMVGSVDFLDPDEGQVNGVLAKRSPGSTLKPFLYGLAYDCGKITPDTVVADVPRTFGEYEPQNYDRTFLGLLPAGEALALSRNIPAVDLLRRTGVERFTEKLIDIGFSSLKEDRLYHGLTLTLGGGEVRLLKIADAYAALARLGSYHPARMAKCERRLPYERVLAKGAAWMVYESLRTVAQPGDPGIAWKTGTSWGHRDAWCIGYDGRYVVGVWMGNFDGRSSEVLAGGTVARPVTFRIFEQLGAANGGYKVIRRPDEVGRRHVCARTGLPAASACPETTLSDYLPGKAAQGRCDVHVRYIVEGNRGKKRLAVAERWGASIDAWLRRTRATADGGGLTSGPYLRIVTPADGDEFALVEDGLAGGERLALLAGGSDDGPFFWYVDNEYVGRSDHQGPFLWTLKEGAHTITVADEKGLSASCRIRVSLLRNSVP